MGDSVKKVNKKLVSDYSNGIGRNKIDELLPEGMELILHDVDDDSIFEEGTCFLANNIEEIKKLSSKGISEKRIYIVVEADAEENLSTVFGLCRPVANDFAALARINEIAEKSNKEGYLQPVGLYVGGGREWNYASIKKLPNISVRGCFVADETEKLDCASFADYVHEAYQVAKRLTVDVPCAMPFMYFEGVAGTAHRLAKEDPENYKKYVDVALDIVSMQNSTAFYATLMV